MFEIHPFILLVMSVGISALLQKYAELMSGYSSPSVRDIEKFDLSNIAQRMIFYGNRKKLILSSSVNAICFFALSLKIDLEWKIFSATILLISLLILSILVNWHKLTRK